MNYPDFHTHHSPPDGPAAVCFNPAAPLPDLPPGQVAVCGIHPWRLDNLSAAEIERELTLVAEHAAAGRLGAIGETGLDRRRGPALELQLELFQRHLALAGNYALPLVIHCVRCVPELLQIKKQTGSSVPWLVHGFNGRLPELEQLIRHGCFVSFGPHTRGDTMPSAFLLKATPLERLGLETDDCPDDIKNIYGAAAACLGIDKLALPAIMEHNFERIFRTTNDR